MKRVLCLYRVSTKGQVEKNDIPLQRISCLEFIEQHPDWAFFDERYERGVSGFKVSAEKRDAILDIRRDAENKAFDVLLVFMSDRLGRKEDETPFLVEWFVKNGIEIWSVCEGQLKIETHTDKLINYIRFWQASGESIKTSERVSERHRQMIEEGIWRGGSRPYGYDLVFKGRIGKKNRQLLDLQINPAEAAIVREIFELVCFGGYGTHRLANYLNDKYPNPEKIWAPRTIMSLLRNPLYTGRLRFNDTLTKAPLEELRIISDSLFEFAEIAIKERIPTKYALAKTPEGNIIGGEITDGAESADGADGADASENAVGRELAVTKTQIYGATLLSGILYCEHCDHKLVGTYTNKENARGEKYYRPIYRCYNGAVKAKNCDGQRTYSAQKIEEAVLSTVRQYFSTFKNTVDELWREQARLQIQRNQGASLKSAQAEVSKLLARQTALKEEAIKALTGESVYEPAMIQELLTSLNVALAKAQEAVQAAQSAKAAIDAKLKTMAEQYENIRDWAEEFEHVKTDEKKMILARIIQRITVNTKYEMKIYFYFTPDAFWSTFEESGKANVKIHEAPLPARKLA